MHTEENDFIIASEEEAGNRLDKVLANRFLNVYSRTYFQYLIEQELVLLNGIPAKKRHKLQLGDEIEIQFAALPDIQLKPEQIPLSILYEDAHLIVVNKPVGMVIHPAPGNWTGTFVNALLYYCGALPDIEHSLRPGIVHRLDKDTSGVLVAAKTLEMQQKLTGLFASREVYKEYLAICLGKGVDGEVKEPIGRHPVNRKQMAVVPTGKQAISFFTTLGWDGKLSLVKAIISTGRTHQIRVHLKHRGTAVLGDPIYGNLSANKFHDVPHQLLHASVLRFRHPVTGELLEFKAPPPELIAQFIKRITESHVKMGRLGATLFSY